MGMVPTYDVRSTASKYSLCSTFVSFSSFWLPMKPRPFVPLPRSLISIERTSHVFPFRTVFFYVVTTDWIFDIMNSINESIKHKSIICSSSVDNH